MPAHPTPPPAPGVGVLLLLPYRHLEQRVLAVVNEAGHAITAAQGRLFQRVAEGGSRLTDLAVAAGMTKQSAGYLVDQLEAAGYLERVQAPGDARARLIVITDRGREVVAVARPVQEAIEAEWEEHLGAEDFASLRDALLRLREITDPWA